MSNQPSSRQDTPTFPVGLLIAGYGTACLGALVLSVLGVGFLATSLTFWLGGAVGVARLPTLRRTRDVQGLFDIRHHLTPERRQALDERNRWDRKLYRAACQRSGRPAAAEKP